MPNRNAGRSERKKKETRLTPRKRNLLFVGGAFAAGLVLGSSILTGAVTPDVATAVATVGSATTGVVALVLRRTPAGPQDDDVVVTLDK
ncbi:hypothetical protein GCM10010317_085830 [Streptomyces mirabilis]|uniref:hypothetical protein n=1 Tax=Streptomyces mirabilis TaxID=68239 RepID=UPI00167EAA56|nr:hypothetical protein [Streptomyces mirabilis]GHD73700.1 hypothetical protein GCM10010317_085830 [Streptomyces mirabilis]